MFEARSYVDLDWFPLESWIMRLYKHVCKDVPGSRKRKRTLGAKSEFFFHLFHLTIRIQTDLHQINPKITHIQLVLGNQPNVLTMSPFMLGHQTTIIIRPTPAMWRAGGIGKLSATRPWVNQVTLVSSHVSSGALPVDFTSSSWEGKVLQLLTSRR